MGKAIVWKRSERYFLSLELFSDSPVNIFYFSLMKVTLTLTLGLEYMFASKYYQTASFFMPGKHFN